MLYSNFIRYFLPFVLFLAVLIRLSFQVFDNFSSPHLWYIYAFFIISSIITYLLTLSASKSSPQYFVRYYMASTGIKLSFYLFIIIAYALINRNEAAGFIISFLILYICFSVFEVFTLIKHFRQEDISK